MVVAESLTDYKRGDSSKVGSLEDSHATGGRDEVSKDHNAPRMGSGKTPNVREGRVRRKRRSLRLKSNASYVMVHIGHGIFQRERHSMP